MKQTITRTLQQNCHIDPHDRYLMATLIEVGDFDADEDPEISYATLKEKLDRGYFAAYPHMKPKQVESNTKEEEVDFKNNWTDAQHEKWIAQSNGWKNSSFDPNSKPLTKQEKEDKANQAIITEINNCTSEKMLSAYKLISANKPALKEAYDKKLSSFQTHTT